LPAPPGQNGSGAGTCADSCCWHWLAAVLLEELQLLKKAVAETRESFVEQEKAFLALESAPDREAYARVLEEHSQLKATHVSLEEEVPVLQRDIAELRAEVEKQRKENRAKAAEVATQEAARDTQDERVQALEAKKAAAEGVLGRVAANKSMLHQELEGAEKRLSQEKSVLDMITSDRDGYKIQANFFSVSRKRSSKGTRASKKSERASNAASRQSSAASSHRKTPNSLLPVVSGAAQRLPGSKPGESEEKPP